MFEALTEEDNKTLFAECKEKLDDVEACLIAMSDDTARRSGERVNRLFRGFHSVKAAAGYLEHEPLKQLSQATESVLAEARGGNVELSKEHIDLLFATTDCMKQMVEGRQRNSNVDFSEELRGLNFVLKGEKGADLVKGPAMSHPNLRPLKVLVVEDDFSSRLVLQGLLSKYGECHIAVNGREAVEAFRTARSLGKGYDLICLDVRMPEVDGQQALEQIREIERSDIGYSPGVRIFMTTSIRDIQTVIASFKAICDAYLIKPINGRELEEHLRSFQLIAI